jgi:hypothetical protein
MALVRVTLAAQVLMPASEELSRVDSPVLDCTRLIDVMWERVQLARRLVMVAALAMPAVAAAYRM